MRKVAYGGAMSLDGFIAGPNGEYDWIVMDPDIDFAGMMARFDTFLIGRKTFDAMRRMGNASPPTPGIRSIVCSRTLRPEDCPGATLCDDAERVVADLAGSRARTSRCSVAASCSEVSWQRGLVDEVSVSLVPVLLGGGIPLLPPPAARTKLKLRTHRLYEKTGTMELEYDIVPK